MSQPKYEVTLSLPNSRPILALAFSPGGQLLACGDSGGNVQLWCTSTGELRQSVRGNSSALSLTWTILDHALHGGFEDGNLVTLILDGASVMLHLVSSWRRSELCDFKQCVVKGLQASQNRLGFLASDSSGLLLATGGCDEVRIWRRENDDKSGGEDFWLYHALVGLLRVFCRHWGLVFHWRSPCTSVCRSSSRL
jgi:WD40 repeat protein